MSPWRRPVETDSVVDLEREDTELLTVSERGSGRHRVLRVSHRGQPLVVKCYGLKRGLFRTIMRHIGSRCIVGKSSIMPWDRRRTESRTIALWRREGFDAPAVLPLELPRTQRALVLEWIPGPTLYVLLADPGLALPKKRELVRTFAQELHRRHARALELNEPGLIYEHPSLQHVIIRGERMVNIDFEIVFTWKKNLSRLVLRELAGFIHSLVRCALPEERETLVREFVDTYPDRSRLEKTHTELEAFGRIPLLKWGSRFLRMMPRRKKKRIPAAILLGEVLRGDRARTPRS